MNLKKTKNYQSICVKDPHIESNHGHIPPIYATSTFTYDDLDAAFAFFRGETKNVYTYSRFSNPNSAFVGQKIAELEACGMEDVEARGILFGSGMAAISSALLAVLNAGDTLLCQSNIYGTSSNLITKELKLKGIESIARKFRDLDEIRNILEKTPGIKAFYLESPTNPTLECVDLQAICELAKAYGVKVIVDNTFATSYVQQPLKFGADIVVYSTTKFMNGHGTGISGAVVTRLAEDHKRVFDILKNFGGVCSPFEAYLLNNGLKTLPLRMDRHQSNAQQLAEFLEKHPKVEKVNFLGLPSHPDYELAKKQMKGPSGMMSFELKGGLEAGMQFQRHLQFCTLTASLGTADTLITHPASTSHSVVPKEIRLANGITDGLIRSSVGIEAIEDIIGDISQALEAI